MFGLQQCQVIYSRISTWFKRGRLPKANIRPVLGWTLAICFKLLILFRLRIRLHDKPQTRSRTSSFIKRGPLSAQISMTDQDMASCASLCKEISAHVDVLQQFERIGPQHWMTQRQIWSVYNVSSPIARQSDHNSFVQWAQNLYENNKRDDVQLRVRLVELVIYKANKRCSTRDHKALLEPHRDDRIGGDVSLVIGLSPPSQYSGCLLRIATSKDGSLWRDKKSSDARKQVLSGRAFTSYDVHLGTCVLSWNAAEHYVTRLHFGMRYVAVVHFRKT